jgi:DNA-binding phage protein
MLTKESAETVQARLQDDQEFAIALFNEAIAALFNSEPELTRLILRDLVNATIGFEALATLTDRPSKSLHRMLSPSGNPTMDNLTLILRTLQEKLNIQVSIQTTPRTPA